MAKNDTIPCATRGILLHYSGQLVYTFICFQVAFKFIHLCLCMYVYVSFHMYHAYYGAHWQRT